MQNRYYSLDVFRGATVALMILVNNPGTWNAMYSPLKHAQWAGCTPTDLVFPFFLFAVGNALAFVVPKMKQKGNSLFWKKVLKRSFLLFFIGLFLNWFPFFEWRGGEISFKEWAEVRVMGVLQRIAIAYLFASVIAYYCRAQKVLFISIGILVLYWLLTLFLGGENPYSIEGFWGNEVDKTLLGDNHLYHGEGLAFDPEGLVSTLPVLPHVLLSYLAGRLMINQGTVRWLFSNAPKANQPYYKLVSMLMVSGTLFLAIGYVWQLEFPIIKKIWSSSYVVFSVGVAMLTMGLMIWFIEILGKRNFLMHFFDVFGKNPLFIFVLSGLIPRFATLIRVNNGVDEKGNPLYISPLHWFYLNICEPLSQSTEFTSFIYSLCFLIFMWIIVYILDKKKIYIKI